MKKIALLTATGLAAFANAVPRVEPVLAAGVIKLELPKRETKRGSVSVYPFASLTEVGMAFGVKNKTAAKMSSIVSNANRKAQINKTDEAGATIFKTKEITAADGSKTVVPTDKPEKVAGMRYFALDVSADQAKALKGTALEGSTVLVYREA